MRGNATNAWDVQQQFLQYVAFVMDGQKAMMDALEFWSDAFDGGAAKTTARRFLEPFSPPKEFVEAGLGLFVMDGQKALIDALEFWSDAFGGGLGKTTTRGFLEPFAPPTSFVEAAFGLAERMIATQKQLALALVGPAEHEEAVPLQAWALP